MTNSPPPRRGRQAEAARNSRKLLEAAREVFISRGFDAPVSAVAERAGIGMGSLYRRYRTKDELLQRLCVDSLTHVADAAREGLAVDDPWQGLTRYIERCVEFGFGALAPLAGRIEATEEMWQATGIAQDLAGQVVARAHAAGVLRGDVTTLDISLLIGQFSRRGPVPEVDHDENVRRRLVAIAVAGLRAGAVEPLPGDPPEQREYESLWRNS
ncbi:TetR/AcrR family transcriptional regulator [Amycolatopsis sp. NPDC052450]|uniref:TetR/AcrR family transcriptional regulator n=1 Tax=Amycolatopsis sp. NPDC052450 TaxID=3363937 RepID=UPI0037CC1727